MTLHPGFAPGELSSRDFEGGAPILKLTAFDLIFPGLLTLTLAVPGWTKSEAGTLAKSVVELTNDVVRRRRSRGQSSHCRNWRR